MLDFLVTSKVRRRMLLLLWGENERGSVTELAEKASVSFASAHAELKRMKQAQLVRSTRDHGVEVLSANATFPHADVLRGLVNATPQPEAASPNDDLVRGSLKTLGAPLSQVEPVAVAPEDQLGRLLEGVELARRDPTVARVLPLCFWRLRNLLAHARLHELATGPEQKHAVGFFLELTDRLGNAPKLSWTAESLRDRRMKTTREFFLPARPDRERTDTFDLAEKWGFRMHMNFESFKTAFDKFVAN